MRRNKKIKIELLPPEEIIREDFCIECPNSDEIVEAFSAISINEKGERVSDGHYSVEETCTYNELFLTVKLPHPADNQDRYKFIRDAWVREINNVIISLS